MRVFCTHETSRSNASHCEEICVSELLNSTLMSSQKCQICGMPLVLDNRFLVENHLGSGSFGRTWLAVDLEGDFHEAKGIGNWPKRAIKQFSPKVASLQSVGYDDLQRRFEEEANRLKFLDHPHIPKFIKYFKINENDHGLDSKEYFYIVQEYIEGRNLKELNVLFPANEIINLLYQILDTLGYIHSKGIIHRDIKPENIIYSEKDKKYYLIDFGAAKNIIPSIQQSTYVPEESTYIPKQTTSVPQKFTCIPEKNTYGRGTRIGTPGFVAPEQWKECRAVFASDQFSLAATCVSLLTQSHEPFLEDLIHSHQWLQYVLTPFGVSAGLLEILSIMLKSEPTDRFPSAAEALKALYQLSPQQMALNSPAVQRALISPRGVINQLFDPIKQYFSSPSKILKRLTLISLSGLLGFVTHRAIYPSNAILNSQGNIQSLSSIVPQHTPTPTLKQEIPVEKRIFPRSSLDKTKKESTLSKTISSPLSKNNAELKPSNREAESTKTKATLSKSSLLDKTLSLSKHENQNLNIALDQSLPLSHKKQSKVTTTDIKGLSSGTHKKPIAVLTVNRESPQPENEQSSSRAASKQPQAVSTYPVIFGSSLRSPTPFVVKNAPLMVKKTPGSKSKQIISNPSADAPSG